MTEDNKPGIDFSKPDGSQFSSGEHGGEIIASDWQAIEGASGVRFRTWKFTEIDDRIVDGALVEIQSGYHTPVQFVETAHTFEEIFQQGNFFILHLTPDGLSVYQYHADDNSSFTLQVNQGEAMCLYTSSHGEVGEVIECEQPGFSTAKLLTIPNGAESFQGLAIPPEFWQVLSLLEHGDEESILGVVDVVDINELV